MADFSNNVKKFKQLRGRSTPASNIIAIGGGKGGVGKSFISSGISIILANLGFKTILVDLDLGAANLHTYLNLAMPKVGLGDFLKEPNSSLNDVLTPTQFSHLHLINGANDSINIPNLNIIDKTKIMSALYNFKADFVVLDLSAGTQATTLDFFLMAKHKLVTIIPEPSSIENAYRFMKATYFRHVQRYEMQLGMESDVKDVLDNCSKYNVRAPADLIRALSQQDIKKGSELKKLMQGLQFNIVMNQTRTHKDVDLGHSIPHICTKYFGCPSHLAASLDYDNAVWQSLRKRRHLLLESPQSRLHAQILTLAKNISHDPAQKAVV